MAEVNFQTPLHSWLGSPGLITENLWSLQRAGKPTCMLHFPSSEIRFVLAPRHLIPYSNVTVTKCSQTYLSLIETHLLLSNPVPSCKSDFASRRVCID